MNQENRKKTTANKKNCSRVLTIVGPVDLIAKCVCQFTRQYNRFAFDDFDNPKWFIRIGSSVTVDHGCGGEKKREQTEQKR